MTSEDCKKIEQSDDSKDDQYFCEVDSKYFRLEFNLTTKIIGAIGELKIVSPSEFGEDDIVFSINPVTCINF